MHYIYLVIAIFAEVVGTTALKATYGFTRIIPTLIVFAGYGISFFFLSLTLKTLAVGVAYAIWSGVGTVLICIIGVIWYHETLDIAGAIGISFIISGVFILNIFSRSVIH